MAGERRGGLGRGLGALIPGDATVRAEESALRQVAINAIQANSRQPRTVFDDDELDGLASSIKAVGLLQPIVVRSLGDERWELVAGERRLRAARRAGMTTIAVIVRETEDGNLLRDALIENIHRVQLNPLEEAAAYGQLLDDFGVTQEELAQRLGKSRPTISNALRLLALPATIQRRVAAGVLTAGHAKALLGLSTAADQEQVAERIVAEGLSVRATEELVRLRYLEEPIAPRGTRARQPLTPSMESLQEDLSNALGQDVRISMGKRKGTLAIAFRSPDDLTHLVEVIARGLHGPGTAVPGVHDISAGVSGVSQSGTVESGTAQPGSVEVGRVDPGEDGPAGVGMAPGPHSDMDGTTGGQQ